jgi:hypothetical protein
MAKYLRVCVADWPTQEIYGFAICGPNHKKLNCGFAIFRLGTPKEFADLQ